MSTNSSDVSYWPPLWRHESRFNDGICSFTHPVVKGPRSRGTVTSHVKRYGQLIREEWVVAIKTIVIESPITINIHGLVVGNMSCEFRHNHVEPYRYWLKVAAGTRSALWRARLLDAWVVALHIPQSEQPPQFRAKKSHSHIMLWIIAQFKSRFYITCKFG